MPNLPSGLRPFHQPSSKVSISVIISPGSKVISSSFSEKKKKKKKKKNLIKWIYYHAYLHRAIYYADYKIRSKDLRASVTWVSQFTVPKK